MPLEAWRGPSRRATRHLAEKHLLEALESSRPWSHQDATRRDVDARINLLLHAIAFFKERNPELITELASEAVELSERLTTDFPSVPVYRQRLERSRNAQLQILMNGDVAAGFSEELIADYLQKYPESPAVHRINAKLLTESENPVGGLTEAIGEFPEQGAYYAARGVLLVEQERIDEALVDFKAAFPTTDSVNKLGVQVADASRELSGRGRYAEALALAELARDAGAKTMLVDAALCEAKLGLGRYEEALTHANAAIEKKPEDSHWLKKRKAEAHFHLKLFTQSLADLQEAYEEHPEDLSTVRWFWPSSVIDCPDENYRKGRAELIQRAFDEHPDKPGALVSHAGLLVFQGNMDQANKEFAKALELAEPDDADFYRRKYIECLTAANMFDEAVALFTQGIEKDNQDPLRYLNRAAFHLKLENYENALADLKTALQLDAPFFLAKYHAALLSLEVGDRDTYAAICQQLLDDDAAVAALTVTEKPMAAWMLALGPQALTDYDPAIALAQTAMDNSPDATLPQQAWGRFAGESRPIRRGCAATETRNQSVARPARLGRLQ